ncbi:Dihydrofolate synthetase [Spathaspora sp. JA1]|nr:Dihydrofolate synthetase [Spathaspora sp. JA1]
MPINLGLTRVIKLLAHLSNPHSCYKSIHVAGTNGKGSVLAYISSILTTAQIRNGKFTSPHLIEYHDCISINNQTYPKSKFEQVHQLVGSTNEQYGLKCTEFELLTVTAFKIFELEKVEIALIEVGVGGALDATNVLEPWNGTGGVIACGITKIGLDHQGLLGDTLSAIAREKSGILKPGIKCFVDGSNDDSVLDVIQQTAVQVKSEVEIVKPELDLVRYSPLHGQYQANNLAISLGIVKSLDYNITQDVIIQGIKSTKWPGRLQSVIHPTIGEILVDGAHNESAAIELGKYINETYDSSNKGVIYIIGITKGKSAEKLLRHIIRDSDSIILTTFTQPENMPWVKPTPVADLKSIAQKLTKDVHSVDDVKQVFDYVKTEFKDKGDDRRVVVCGSLYLVADILHQVGYSCI